MENSPSKQERQDELDTKLGRPVRSKMPKAWTESGDTGEMKENGDSNAKIMQNWATAHSIGTYIDDCKVTNSNVADLFTCVAASFFAGDSNLNSDVCAQMDAYEWLAFAIATGISETLIASDSTYLNMNQEGFAETKSLPAVKTHLRAQSEPITKEKKKLYDAAAVMTGFTEGWLAASGSLEAAQTSINNLGYCDEVLTDAFVTERMISQYENLWTYSGTNAANLEAVTQDLAENGMPGTCPDGGTDCNTGKYMLSLSPKMVAPTENFYRRFHAKTFRESNRELRKKGIFHRRRPHL